METDRAREDEWFLKNEKQLIEAARLAREKRDSERREREREDERRRMREQHFMKCPKCGHDLREQVLSDVTVDVCSFCEGVFFDAGELDTLFLKREDERKGVLRKLLRF